MSPAAALPRTTESERGFTLLEMLMVLGITALIAGLLYPQIETARFAVRQRLAREQAAAAVEAARAAALRSGAPAALSADRDATALVVSGARRFPVDPGRVLGLALRPQTILFYPDGSTTGGRLTLGNGREARAFAIAPAGWLLLPAAPAGTGG